jgi:hypothetical protein
MIWDGTFRFMALATLFLQPEQYRPSVILVDEPELGLHPYAITMLASLNKQASAKTGCFSKTHTVAGSTGRFGPPGWIIPKEKVERRYGSGRLGAGTKISREKALRLIEALAPIARRAMLLTANCWGVDNNCKGTNTNRVVVFSKPDAKKR